jgi:hypothetical protein
MFQGQRGKAAGWKELRPLGMNLHFPRFKGYAESDS